MVDELMCSGGVGPCELFSLRVDLSCTWGVFVWCWCDERNKLHFIYGSVYREAELDLESWMCIVGK